MTASLFLRRVYLRPEAGLAYDRELSRELTGLEEQFKRWHSGEITAHDVNDQIHKFHQGPLAGSALA